MLREELYMKIQRAKNMVHSLKFRSDLCWRYDDEQDKKNQDSLLSLAPKEEKCFKERVANIAGRQ